MAVRITVNILRVAALIALIFGILIWVNVLPSIVGIHMLLGIVVTLALWALGYLIATAKGGNIGLGIGAFVWGLVVVVFGLTQQKILAGSSVHWIIQVLHLLIGLVAIGFGEMIGGRYRRIGGSQRKLSSEAE